MSILQQIKDAQLTARKARDSVKLTTLITLIGEITTFEKRENREATDKDVTKILTKFRDNAQQMAQAYGDRRDAENFEAFSKEVEVYESFIPAAKPQLSDEALHRIVRSAIASRIVGDGVKPKMGVVISDVKMLHDGTYDPKKLAPLVKAELDATADL